jgi:hypothetical protein
VERQRLFEKSRGIFASIEEIPTHLERSPLQRVIQLLKRHRDRYYTRDWNDRPISAIISTLAAKIASHAAPNSNVLTLLSVVADGLLDYAELLTGKQPKNEIYSQRQYISRENQKWKILNPVNPNDNYADSWDENTAKRFFQWARTVSQDFSNARSDEDFIQSVKNGMGDASFGSVAAPAIHINRPVNIQTGTKPYRDE